MKISNQVADRSRIFHTASIATLLWIVKISQFQKFVSNQFSLYKVNWINETPNLGKLDSTDTYPSATVTETSELTLSSAQLVTLHGVKPAHVFTCTIDIGKGEEYLITAVQTVNVFTPGNF